MVQRLFLLVIALIGPVYITASIPCDSVQPDTPTKPSESPFFLVIRPSEYTKNEPVEVRLTTYSSSPIQQFRINAYSYHTKRSWKPAGQFVWNVREYMVGACAGSSTNNSLVSVHSDGLSFWSADGKWIPPADDEPDSYVVFFAAVTDSSGNTFTGLQSRQVKRSAKDDNETRIDCSNVSPEDELFPVPPQYRLVVNTMMFSPGQTLKVTIDQAATTRRSFTKFHVAAFNSYYDRVGRFSPDSASSAADSEVYDACSDRASSIVQADNDQKYSVSVVWYPPANPPTLVIFAASVVDFVDDRRHVGILSDKVYLSRDNVSIQASNPWLDCELATPTRVNATPGDVYRLDVFDYQWQKLEEFDWNLPVLVVLNTTSMSFFTNYRLRAFDEAGRSLGSFTSSQRTPHSFQGYCDSREDSMYDGDRDRVVKKNESVWVWVPPRDYTSGKVRFVVAVQNFFKKSLHVLSSAWIPAQSQSLPTITCPMATPTSEAFPRSGWFKLTVSRTDYARGDTIAVSLRGYNSAKFTNFLLRAYDQEGGSVGKFSAHSDSLNPPSTAQTCDTPWDAIRSGNSDLKTKATVTWHVPEALPLKVMFVAVVINDQGHRYTGITYQWLTVTNDTTRLLPCPATPPERNSSALYQIHFTDMYNRPVSHYDRNLPLYVTLNSTNANPFMRFRFLSYTKYYDQYSAYGKFRLSSRSEYVNLTSCREQNDSVIESRSYVRFSATVLWVPPDYDQESVRFIAYLMDMDGIIHEVVSPWLANMDTEPSATCQLTTPQAETYPDPSPCGNLTLGVYHHNGTFQPHQYYTENSTVQVHLGCSEEHSFEGFMIRAFDGDGNAVGAFISNGTDVKTCDVTNDTAYTTSMDTSSHVTALWRPMGRLPNTVQFIASYVSPERYRTYIGLRSRSLPLRGATNPVEPSTNTTRYFNVSCSDLSQSDGRSRAWFTVSDDKHGRRNASVFDINKPLFVTVTVAGGLQPFLAFRIAARDPLGRPSGRFQPLYRYPANYDRVGTEVCPLGGTALNSRAFHGWRVTVMWTPTDSENSVTFYGAVIDSSGDLIPGLVSEPISPTIAPIGASFHCERTTVGTEPFGNFTDYQISVHFVGPHAGNRRRLQVTLKAMNDSTFDGYLIRAFDEHDQPITEFLYSTDGVGTQHNPYYCGQAADSAILKAMRPAALITAHFAAPEHVLAVRFVASVSRNGRLTTGIVSAYHNTSETLLSQLGLACDDVTADVITTPTNPQFEFHMNKIVQVSSGYQTVHMQIIGGSPNQIRSYTIRSFDRSGRSIGRFRQSTSVMSVSQAHVPTYNASLVTCDVINDTLRNVQDWPRRYNMTFQWYAPLGAAEVKFVMTIIDTGNAIYRGVKSSWVSLTETCAPDQCYKHAHQRHLCNMTGSYVNPEQSDYIIGVNQSEFTAGSKVQVRVYSATNRQIHAFMLRVFTDDQFPSGTLTPPDGQNDVIAQTSCQTDGDTVWNKTETLPSTSNAAGAIWRAPEEIGPEVMYIYFVAYVYDGAAWSWAKRSARVYVKSAVTDGGNRTSFSHWCNLTNWYAPSTASSGGYKIKAPLEFEDGRPIKVEIDSGWSTPMLGYMVRAYDQTGKSVGKFSHAPYASHMPQLYTCQREHDAFVNKTSGLMMYSREAMWSNNGQNVQNVQFIATVYNENGQLYTGIKSHFVKLKGVILGGYSQLSCVNTSLMVPAPTEAQFYLEVSAKQFNVQQQLYVSIKTKGIPFKGFIIRAFGDKYQSVGVFSHSYMQSTYHAKTIKCATHSGDSITNSTADTRTSQTVMWIAPATPPSAVIFVASVVDDMGRVTNSIRSAWIGHEGGGGVVTTPAPPHVALCSDTEPHVETDPPYPPIIIEPANGSYSDTQYSRHIQLTSYGTTDIHFYFLRAYDHVGKPVGTFDSHTWSQNYGSSVNYVNADLVTCERVADSIMSDLSATPRRSLVIKFTAPSRDTPDQVMFIAVVRDSAGITYKAIKSKWITVDSTLSAGTTTKASSVILLTFPILLTSIFLLRR